MGHIAERGQGAAGEQGGKGSSSGYKVDEGSALIALKEAVDKRRDETEKAIEGKDDL